MCDTSQPLKYPLMLGNYSHFGKILGLMNGKGYWKFYVADKETLG